MVQIKKKTVNIWENKVGINFASLWKSQMSQYLVNRRLKIRNFIWSNPFAEVAGIACQLKFSYTITAHWRTFVFWKWIFLYEIEK